MDSVRSIGPQATAGTVAALVAADGTAADPFVRRLLAPGAGTRDLADAVHSICALHGSQPGVLDHAMAHTASPGFAAWLSGAATAFGDERSYLTQVAAASGPLPSTPGQAESEAAVIAQHHALDMLAQSDRTGCAAGAAAALALDWQAVRRLLDVAATRFGITAVPLTMDAGPALTRALGEVTGVGPERAMAFGAQQLLAQHRGLWRLLEARASARDHL